MDTKLLIRPGPVRNTDVQRQRGKGSRVVLVVADDCRRVRWIPKSPAWPVGAFHATDEKPAPSLVCPKKTYHGRVVVEVALATHGGLHPELLEQLPERQRTVLAAAIRMVQQSDCRPLGRNNAKKRLDDQIFCHARRHGWNSRLTISFWTMDRMSKKNSSGKGYFRRRVS